MKGVSLHDVRNIFGGSFDLPDTLGAVGATPFPQTADGVYALYRSSTGAVQPKVDARVVWAAAGMSGGGTWIAEIKLGAVGAVPELQTCALMFGGLLAMAARRQHGSDVLLNGLACAARRSGHASNRAGPAYRGARPDFF